MGHSFCGRAGHEVWIAAPVSRKCLNAGRFIFGAATSFVALTSLQDPPGLADSCLLHAGLGSGALNMHACCAFGCRYLFGSSSTAHVERFCTLHWALQPTVELLLLHLTVFFGNAHLMHLISVCSSVCLRGPFQLACALAQQQHACFIEASVLLLPQTCYFTS
jgi:hypothetical protein